MEAEREHYAPGDQASIASVLREVGTSVKDLMRSEVNLVKAEIKNSTKSLGSHLAQATIFGSLTLISILPFLAFLVIGMGRLLGDRYWMSSLIVAVVCAAVFGGLAFRAYKMLKNEVTLPRTRESLERSSEIFADRTESLRDAASANNVSDFTHNRRRVS
jgi:uncharacterized membrane protein YqjE